MQHNISEHMEIPELLMTVYQEMAISPIILLQNYAIHQIRQKIHKLEADNGHYQKKYSCSFSDFKQRIDRMKNEENFEWEDDLMDWQFAVENLAVWQKKEKLIMTTCSK